MNFLHNSQPEYHNIIKYYINVIEIDNIIDVPEMNITRNGIEEPNSQNLGMLMKITHLNMFHYGGKY